MIVYQMLGDVPPVQLLPHLPHATGWPWSTPIVLLQCAWSHCLLNVSRCGCGSVRTAAARPPDPPKRCPDTAPAPGTPTTSQTSQSCAPCRMPRIPDGACRWSRSPWAAQAQSETFTTVPSRRVTRRPGVAASKWWRSLLQDTHGIWDLRWQQASPTAALTSMLSSEISRMLPDPSPFLTVEFMISLRVEYCKYTVLPRTCATRRPPQGHSGRSVWNVLSCESVCTPLHVKTRHAVELCDQS